MDTIRVMRTAVKALVITAAVAVAVAGCSIDQTTAPGTLAAGDYTTFDSCAEVEAYVAEHVDRVDPYAYPMPMMERAVGMPAGVPTADAGAGAAGSEQSSKTNTQEAGVDEGDLVDHDGRRLFSAVDERLQVVDLATGDLLDDLALPQGVHHLVLDGDVLLVATEQYTPVAGVVVARYRVVDEVTLVDRVLLEGSLAAVRASGGVARVVLAHRFTERYWATATFGPDGTVTDTEPLTVDDIVPRRAVLDDTGVPGPATPAVDCTDIGTPSDFSGLAVTWVAAFDLTDPAASAIAEAAVIAETDAVYATADQIVLATHSHDTGTDGARVGLGVPATTATQVHRFTTDALGALGYASSGEVPGRVVNRFAIRATDDHVFVATTVDATEFATVKASRISVLADESGELVVVSVVDGLGIDEDIQSVRYVGDRAYVVTFRTVDPLYVVDLADPENPALLGELKIPGFSTYLHPVGDGLLVGVGFDADPSSGAVTSAQLSLFDVTDPQDPRRVATADLGDHSAAAYDPHAFTHAVEAGLIAVPFSVYGFTNDCPPPPVDGVSTALDTGCVQPAPVDGVRVFDVGDGGLGLVAELPVPAVRTVFAGERFVVVGYGHIVGFDADSFAERFTLQSR